MQLTDAQEGANDALIRHGRVVVCRCMRCARTRVCWGVASTSWITCLVGDLTQGVHCFLLIRLNLSIHSALIGRVIDVEDIETVNAADRALILDHLNFILAELHGVDYQAVGTHPLGECTCTANATRVHDIRSGKSRQVRRLRQAPGRSRGR